MSIIGCYVATVGWREKWRDGRRMRFDLCEKFSDGTSSTAGLVC